MKNQASTSAVSRTSVVPTRIAKPFQLLGTFVLGTVILFGAGFVQMPAVHDAAHDMRHSAAFPCH